MRGSLLVPILGALLLSTLGAAETAPAADRVLRHPRPEAPLMERIEWARGEAGRLSLKDGFWIAYGIRRLTGEHSFFGRFDGWTRRNRPTLEDIVSPRPAVKPLPDDEVIKKAAQDALDRSDPKRPPERMVWKDTGLLMKYGSPAEDRPAAIYLSDLSLPFDLEGLTLLWLGPAQDADSVLYLKALYGRMASAVLKEDILDAIGLHRNPDQVIPFLEEILRGPNPDSLRENAASLLGEQQDERAVAILKRTVRTDPSAGVRDEALDALAETELTWLKTPSSRSPFTPGIGASARTLFRRSPKSRPASPLRRWNVSLRTTRISRSRRAPWKPSPSFPMTGDCPSSFRWPGATKNLRSGKRPSRL